jgi:hypothetical protein
MSFLGIELNDIALTGATEAGIVFTEPGYAYVDGGQIRFGEAAQQTARRKPRAFYDCYWRDLSDKPLVGAAGELQTSADLVHAQLQQLWSGAGAGIEQVFFAVPSWWSTEQLALLLGISEEIGIPLRGMAQMPVAATRRPYPDYELLHIETGLHAVRVNRMQAGEAAVDTGLDTITDFGTAVLRRTCIEYFSKRFLEDSRFDPLQDAESEQGIYDLLDEWLGLLSRQDAASVSYAWRGNEYAARADVAGLSELLRRRCQPLIQALRSAVSIDQPSALQIDAQLAEFPGMVDMLLELPGCDVFVLEPGAAARGLLARRDRCVNNGTGYSLTKSLPLDQPATEATGQSSSVAATPLPTHLLYEGTAYRISDQPFRIGAELAAGDYGVVVSSRHTGVSRQHCSIEIADGRALLNDYSRFGTLLNGRKVQESAVLQPGDVVSMGDPACDFRLIAETGPDGA